MSSGCSTSRSDIPQISWGSCRKSRGEDFIRFFLFFRPCWELTRDLHTIGEQGQRLSVRTERSSAEDGEIYSADPPLGFFCVRKMIKEALQNVSFSRGRIRKLCNSETRVGFWWELLFFSAWAENARKGKFSSSNTQHLGCLLILQCSEERWPHLQKRGMRASHGFIHSIHKWPQVSEKWNIYLTSSFRAEFQSLRCSI